MLSNFPINMNCSFCVHMAEFLQSAVLWTYIHTYLGYPCAKFRLPRPFDYRVRADVRDIRRTDGETDGRRTPMTA